jgi:hypothetical protein
MMNEWSHKFGVSTEKAFYPEGYVSSILTPHYTLVTCNLEWETGWSSAPTSWICISTLISHWFDYMKLHHWHNAYITHKVANLDFPFLHLILAKTQKVELWVKPILNESLAACWVSTEYFKPWRMCISTASTIKPWSLAFWDVQGINLNQYHNKLRTHHKYTVSPFDSCKNLERGV